VLAQGLGGVGVDLLAVLSRAADDHSPAVVFKLQIPCAQCGGLGDPNASADEQRGERPVVLAVGVEVYRDLVQAQVPFGTLNASHTSHEMTCAKDVPRPRRIVLGAVGAGRRQSSASADEHLAPRTFGKLFGCATGAQHHRLATEPCQQRKAPQMRGSSNALEGTRTTTGRKAHKALNPTQGA